MIDIHSHVINEIDDGARSLKESLTLLKKLNGIGFTHVVATPHYITGSQFISNNYQKNEKWTNLVYEIEKENIETQLYLGNEIFIDFSISSLLKKNEIAPINGSRYLLIEFPITNPIHDMMEILFYLRSKDFVPIIAHPERYIYFQENHDLIFDLLKMGCLFQGNLANVLEKYGLHAKKLFMYMLKNNQYQFLATDVHHEDDILFKKMKKVKKEIIKLTSKEKFHELTYENPLKVLKDENIIVQSEEN